MCGSSISAISIANTAVGVIAGIFIKEIWDYFRRPLVKVSFDEHAEGCRAHTRTGGNPPSEGYYIRAKVVNSRRRLAKSCRAFLVNVEQRNARGEFVPTTPAYDDSLALVWSAQFKEGNPPIDLPYGISQFVDIVSTDKLSAEFKVHALIPYRYDNLFNNTPKALRFTIAVTGDDVEPGQVKVIFDWRGKWDNFELAQG
jgi:hypothetical protein